MKDLKIETSSTKIIPLGYRMLEVSLEDVENSNILDQFTIDEILSHFNINDILEQIGKEKVCEYFGLIDE
jgi:hypothetical protein